MRGFGVSLLGLIGTPLQEVYRILFWEGFTGYTYSYKE
jgi:hypothetical protein